MDETGIKGAKNWSSSLRCMDVDTDIYDFDKAKSNDGNLITDLNDLLQANLDDWDNDPVIRPSSWTLKGVVKMPKLAKNMSEHSMNKGKSNVIEIDEIKFPHSSLHRHPQEFSAEAVGGVNENYRSNHAIANQPSICNFWVTRKKL